MAAIQSVIRVHRQAEVLTVQVEGQGTMPLSLPLRAYVENCLAEGVTALRVDLRNCIYMDSTFMGTLLFLQRHMTRLAQGRLTLLAPSPQCRQLLHTLNMEKLFPIENVSEVVIEIWQDLPCATPDMTVFKHNVVQAHRELACLEGAAGEPFRAMVRGFDEETKTPSSK